MTKLITAVQPNFYHKDRCGKSSSEEERGQKMRPQVSRADLQFNRPEKDMEPSQKVQWNAH